MNYYRTGQHWWRSAPSAFAGVGPRPVTRGCHCPHAISLYLLAIRIMFGCRVDVAQLLLLHHCAQAIPAR